MLTSCKNCGGKLYPQEHTQTWWCEQCRGIYTLAEMRLEASVEPKTAHQHHFHCDCGLNITEDELDKLIALVPSPDPVFNHAETPVPSGGQNEAAHASGEG